MSHSEIYWKIKPQDIITVFQGCSSHCAKAEHFQLAVPLPPATLSLVPTHDSPLARSYTKLFFMILSWCLASNLLKVFFPDTNKVKTRQIPWSSNIRTRNEASSGAVTGLYTWRHYMWPIYFFFIQFITTTMWHNLYNLRERLQTHCISATVSRLVRLLPSRLFRSLWRETQWQWWDANRLEGWYIGMKQIGSWIGNVSVRERMFVYSSRPSSSLFWFWY